MGHILTWLIKDLADDGSFSMKEVAEQAYSRIRGVQCTIEPRSNTNPVFWIAEVVDQKTNKPIPHVEAMKGMFGYYGEIDYSNHQEITEYHLIG